MRGGKGWKSIGVREEVKKIIDEIAKRRGWKKYQVVELAIRQFAKEQKYGKKEKKYHWGYDIDRELWYAFKLVNSIAQLKFAVEEFNDEDRVSFYKKLTMQTISQIEERLGVDLDNVRKAVEKFLENPTGRSKADLNDETKIAMARILFQ